MTPVATQEGKPRGQGKTNGTQLVGRTKQPKLLDQGTTDLTLA